MSIFHVSRNGTIGRVEFGESISLEESYQRELKEAEDHCQELELILSMDDKTFENELVQNIVQDAIEDAKRLLTRIHETTKAIAHWQAQGKDTSKTHDQW